MRKRVIFVEDDDVIRDNYTELLGEEGFIVEAFRDQHSALTRAQEALPDIALLDISLNNERDAGFQLCADLRRLSAQLPIIFLTSHDSEFDKISGIRLGADDYLIKDVSLEYLVVRMEALLRRIETLTHATEQLTPSAQEQALEQSLLSIDNDQSVMYWRRQKIDLTLTQFWITQELARNPGQLKNYAALMKAANIYVEPNTITAHIKTIRDRFKDIDAEFDCIKTERGSGYRWVDN